MNTTPTADDAIAVLHAEAARMFPDHERSRTAYAVEQLEAKVRELSGSVATLSLLAVDHARVAAAAARLHKRGFFEAVSCADAPTLADMAQMREALAALLIPKDGAA